MILKEPDPLITEDPLQKAGQVAEEQMAFYLRRAFGDAPDILVLNGIRLEQQEDAAQIDHLILHRNGIIIVESKSVTGTVSVNERGEWTRRGRFDRGMPSPLLQGRRQGDFLRGYLSDHAELLRGKLLGRWQAGFGIMPIGVLVAISDSGIIERPGNDALPEVLKADQVPDQVRVLIKTHRRLSSPLSLNMKDLGDALTREELDRVGNFLLQHHRPLADATRAVSPPASHAPAAAPRTDHGAPAAPSTDRLATAATPRPDRPSPAARPEPRPAAHAPESPRPAPTGASAGTPASASTHAGGWRCRHCHGAQIRIEWGRYGYYFKCQQCQGNTPLNLTCPRCQGKERTRKSGNQFYRECGRCGTSAVFFTNDR